MSQKLYNAEQFLAGEVLFIDKFPDWTSFDVVNKIRSTLKYQYNIPKIKVGHAGTLDPLATGLLIVCTGKKTKEIQSFQDFPKEYITTIKLGETTPSFDLETKVDNTFSIEKLTEESVKEAILSFRGKQLQMPPDFSAKRVNGKRAYENARKGKSVDLKPSEIEIFNIEVLNINLPFAEIKINCSKGTYIRAIARDIGKKLKNGAHLTELRRTKIGKFSVENAITVDLFQNLL
ncbi:MAG: tRNA pseudouridine(55) synthase TruB [Chlorobi bacterium]|nr:tRNA pseudouridine(55) synthase TruB [Chlorobiota bacterium]